MRELLSHPIFENEANYGDDSSTMTSIFSGVVYLKQQWIYFHAVDIFVMSLDSVDIVTNWDCRCVHTGR